MIQSYYKYGPVRANYGVSKRVNSIKSLKKYLDEYERTGNIEFLTDVANFAMIEFMYPSVKGARFARTGDKESPGLHIHSEILNEIYSMLENGKSEKEIVKSLKDLDKGYSMNEIINALEYLDMSDNISDMFYSNAIQPLLDKYLVGNLAQRVLKANIL